MTKIAREVELLALSLMVALLAQGCSRTAKVLPPTLEVSEQRLKQRALAHQHFLNGVFLEQEGELPSAVEEYKTALGFDPQSSEIRYSLANAFLQMNDFRSAAKVAERISPLDAKGAVLLAETYQQMKQDSLAVRYYRLAVSLNDRDFDSHYSLSRLLKRTGEVDAAIYHLKKVLELSPGFRSGYMELAALYVQKGDCELSVQSYRTVVTLYPDYLPAQWGLAESYAWCGQREEALETYRRINELSPGNVPYKRRLLDAYINQGDLNGAVGVAEELSALEPLDLFAKMGLGMLYISTGNYPGADSVFSLVLEEDPENIEARLNRGRVNLQMEELEEARADFEKVIALSDSLPDGWRDLALTYVSWDSTEKAIEILRRGLEKVSDRFPLYYFLAITLHRQGNYLQAVEPLERAQEIHPQDTGVRLLLAEVYEYTGRTDKALEILEDLVENDPENATAANNLGYLLTNLEVRLEEAKELILRALEAEPDNPAFLDSFGWVLFKLKHHQEAQSQIEKALSGRAEDPIILEHMGDILQARGKQNEAWEYWRKALELDPQNEELKRKLGID
jgi:tetratricopeptide (TPR) repeat protein